MSVKKIERIANYASGRRFGKTFAQNRFFRQIEKPRFEILIKKPLILYRVKGEKVWALSPENAYQFHRQRLGEY